MNSRDPERSTPKPDAERVEELFHEAAQMRTSEQSAFLSRACKDESLRERVSSLLKAGSGSSNDWDRGALELEARHTALHGIPARSGEFFGPYRIVRCIAAGGMGFVYEAMRDDAEFQKRVAIKFLQQGIDDPTAVERFRSERQILAQLEHPNIARLLDGGTTENGIPYLVMEFVDGEQIDRWVARCGFTRDERLKLFLEVCEAVQHAHRNLIVHRDLKPGNIMMTSNGVPKLLDFGIARLLTKQSNTATQRALTPEYASPEQLLGSNITTASDIYSLGVLLFVLLAERLPYRTTAEHPVELVRAICEEDPVWAPPGLIRGDLQSILTKALHKEPHRRYLSVEQFAADVRRYLEGYPVSARAPSRWYPAARFCVRNKALTIAIAALALSIGAGLAVSTWEARRATQQALLAERRLSEARRLIYSVIHDIQPKLAGIDGTVAVQAAMVDQTMGYLEVMGKDAGDNAALMRELIDGYLELAKLTGGGSYSNVGNAQTAGEILKKAATLMDTLLRVEQPNAATLRLGISLYGSVALQERQYGSHALAISYARRALGMAERLSFTSGGDRPSQDIVAKASVALANVLTDDLDEEIRLYERSASIWSQALQEDPANSSKLRENVALMDRNLSNAWVDKQDLQRAINLAINARDIDQQLLSESPTSPAARMNLAFDLGALAFAYDKKEDYKQAVEAQRENVTIRDRIVAANPDDFRAAERLAYALQFLAYTENRAGEQAAAVRDYRRALGLYADLHRRGTLVQDSLFTYASAILKLVHIEGKSRGNREYCAWLMTMLDVLNVYQDRASLSPDALQELDQMRQEARGCPP